MRLAASEKGQEVLQLASYPEEPYTGWIPHPREEKEACGSAERRSLTLPRGSLNRRGDPLFSACIPEVF